MGFIEGVSLRRGIVGVIFRLRHLEEWIMILEELLVETSVE